MPVPGIVAAGITTVRAIGGIMGKGSKNINPVYKNQGFSESVLKTPSYTPKNSLPKTQAQINSEGAAKARAAMGLSPKPTAQEIASRASKEKASLMKSRIKKGN